VFVCFTLSQAGIVRHWLASHEPGWRWRAALNGVGAAATGVVAGVQVLTKFTEGAWIVVIIIPLIIVLLRKIHRHYQLFHAGDQVHRSRAPHVPPPHRGRSGERHHEADGGGAGVRDDDLRGRARAVRGGRAGRHGALVRTVEGWDIGVDLTVVPSPYRSVLRPIVGYVTGLIERGEADLVTVVVPEIVPREWWEHLLHNKTALFIRTAFLFKPNVVVTAVPYLLGRAARLSDLVRQDEFWDGDAEEREVLASTAASAPHVVRTGGN
jgi:hypothetical protein